TSESGVAGGVRRIEAITGRAAYERLKSQERTLQEAAGLLRTREENLLPRLERLLEEQRELGRQLERARASGGGDVLGQLLSQAVSVDGARVIAAAVEAGSAEELRALGDRLRERLGSGVAVLAASVGDRTSLLAVATDDLIQRGVRADQVVREVAALAGGKGGGKAHMAQAGISDPGRIPEALAQVVEVVRPLLAGSGV
ncbi:MAG: DHHA1 domain-containing protein, partial [Longimicrobiaceae bacterium]